MFSPSVPHSNLDHASSSLSPNILVPLFTVRDVMSKKKNARKFLIHLLCHEVRNLQVARGHIHSLSPHTPKEELDRGFPSASPCHLEQIQMIKWQALPREPVLFPRKPQHFPSHPIFRMQILKCCAMKKKRQGKKHAVSLSPSSFPLPCKQY